MKVAAFPERRACKPDEEAPGPAQAEESIDLTARV